MPSPEKNPTDPRPDHAGPSNTTPDQSSENAATISTTPNIDTDANTDTDTDTNMDVQASGLTPSSTQQNMGDGTGIRGDYGDANQTNGLEGGPDRPQTDTELTGS